MLRCGGSSIQGLERSVGVVLHIFGGHVAEYMGTR